MKFWTRLAWLTCTLGVAALPTITWAQSAGATLQGTVVDEQGGVLPGAIVTITNSETGWVRAITTDERGWYRAVALVPGTYELAVEIQGFVRQRRSGMNLTVGQEANIDLTMKVALLEETVTVTAAAPLVTTTSSTLGTTVSRGQLDSLPLPGRNFNDLANLAPGMQGVGGGGTVAAGQLSRNTSTLVDGASHDQNVTAGRRGGYSLETVREFVVMSSQFTAEYGMAAGAILSAVTRSGTNDTRGRAFLFHRGKALNARDAFSRSQNSGKAPFSQQIFGGFLGGPIVQNRLHYFGAYEGQRRRETSVITSPLVPVDEREVPETTDAKQFFIRNDYRINNNHSVNTRVRFDGSKNIGSGIGGLNTRERGVDNKPSNEDVLATHTAVLSSRALNEFRFQAAYLENNSDSDPYRPNGTATINRPSGNFGKASNMPQFWTQDLYQFVNTFSYTLGSHDMKAGLDVSIIKVWSYFLSNKDGTFTFRTDAPYNAADPSTYAFQYTQMIGDPVTIRDNELFSFFVQDTWRYRRGLTFNVGLRYDTENAFKKAALIGLPDSRTNFAPRLGVAWDPFGNGHTAVRGGYGMYYDKSFSNITGNITKGIRSIAITILNPGFPNPLEGGVNVPQKQSVMVPPPDVHTPVTHSMSGGFKHEVRPGLAISADLVGTRGYNHYNLFDTNYPDPVTGLRPNQDMLRVTRYEMTGDSWYSGLLIGMERRSGRGPLFNVAYTLSKSIRNVEDFGFQGQANDRSIEKALADNHRKHQLVASTTLALPWGFQVAAILQARSGLPWTVTTGTDNNADTVVNDRPDLAVPGGDPTDRATYFAAFAGRVGNLGRNTNIGSSFMTIDARVSKFVMKNGHRQIEAFAEAFNVTNRTNFGLPNGNLRSAAFGRSTAITGNPRQIELGVRFDF